MKTGLLGYPLAHSLSPLIHTAAYEELGLDWEYGLYPCEDRAAFLRVLAEARGEVRGETRGEAWADPAAFVGFNVTTPYKVDAYGACTEHSPSSAVAGGANVLTFLGDTLPGRAQPRMRGDNTDGRGLVASLEHEGGVAVAGSSVVLCGTGPVALSALSALVEARVAEVCVASRTPGKGREHLRLWRERFDRVQSREPGAAHDASPVPVAVGEPAQVVLCGTGPVAPGELVPVAPGEPAQAEPGEPKATEPGEPVAPSRSFPSLRVVSYAQAAAHLATADILIDATPVGMDPADAAVVPPKALRPGLVVLDTVYGHGETALLRGARAAGAVAIDGLGMLIEQAALTIEIWARAQGTPLEAPRKAMRQAALKAGRR